jgi:tRNA A-37 threonylcarbamoyl transferase component Bud32
LIVVKSIRLPDSVEDREIKNAIETSIRLHRRSIAGAIGFVFPVKSADGRELKIVQLFIEGTSLEEALTSDPAWWTATAKAVAGIALRLDFVHSLGLVHGDLTASNIIFDSERRIEIADFLIGLEGDDGEKVLETCVRTCSKEG